MTLHRVGIAGVVIAQNRGNEKENSAAMQWVRKSLDTAFSFQYASQSSAAFLRQWKQASSSRTFPDGRVELTKIFKDPATGLEVRVESTVFPDFPAVEWVMHFKNTGTSDSPILENILPLDAALPMTGGPEPARHPLCQGRPLLDRRLRPSR